MGIPTVVGATQGGRYQSGTFDLAIPAGSISAIASFGMLVNQYTINVPLVGPAGWVQYTAQANPDLPDWFEWHIWVAQDAINAGTTWTFNTSENAVESIAGVVVGLGENVIVDAFDYIHYAKEDLIATVSSPSITTSQAALIIRGVSADAFSNPADGNMYTVTYPEGHDDGQIFSLIDAGWDDAIMAVAASSAQNIAGPTGLADWILTSPGGQGGFSAPSAFTLAVASVESSPLGMAIYDSSLTPYEIYRLSNGSLQKLTVV